MTYADQLAQKRMLKEAAEEAARDTMVEIKSQQATQRYMWLSCAAMNDAFGIGAMRFEKFAEALQARVEWYQELERSADEQYADEKLRQEASRCSGMEIRKIYEDLRPGCNYERIRMMSVEQMARFIPEELLGLGEERLESAEGAWKRWLLEKPEEVEK